MHVAGEAPPELSPLDAFAMQSRMLAKQLQESEKEGNRLSRLPPLTVESPLIVQGRSEYFRSLSYEDENEEGGFLAEEQPGLGLRTAYEEPSPEERPQSMHPHLGRIPPTPDSSAQPDIPQTLQELSRGRQLNQISEDQTFFGARRERSPSPLNGDNQTQSDKPIASGHIRSEHSLSKPSPLQNASLPGSPEKHKQSSLDDIGLAPPPRSIFPKRSSSIMSSPLLPPEEDATSNMGASFHSLPARKLSSGSVAFPNSAGSPAFSHFHRSPSVGSTDSAALPRPSFNFSRPLSRAGTPSFEPPSRLDTPSRQASSDSQPSFVLADESAHTPVSMHSEAFADTVADDNRPGAPSYIYSKFSLPRGKTIQRSEPSEPQSQASFLYDTPMVPPSNVQKIPAGAPPSPPSRPSTASARPLHDDGMSTISSLTRPSTEAGKRSMDSAGFGAGLAPVSSRPSLPDISRQSEDAPRGRPRTSPLHDTARGRTPASTNTSDSASTIRPPPTARSNAPTASEMSAEEHLAKGIECHENGSLNESTYHLRYAARQNNPTAMLLYALACRHGWGMRANQKEGVEWLRKAAEYASIEIADEEEQAKEGKHIDAVEKRTRKASFALSIYELGVSHMNGWGIEQDKTLAVRCFEIAGTWGDVDALAEAGFCYAQGIGCKKNLKKSARFYRMAEAKGMSMVGNSWIHKAKYLEDENDTEKSPKKDKKKARSKSRTRAMFGLRSGN